MTSKPVTKGDSTLERELAKLVEYADYEVRFQKAEWFDWFTVYVLYDGNLIAERAVCKSYPRAARWARRQVRRHQKGLRRLGPLHGAAS